MALLNLASRPARNETLPALAFYVALVALLALTVKHAFVVASLLPGRTSARRNEVLALEREAGRIRAETAALRGPAPDKAVVARWAALKELVDRRTFSWTRLLARLETVMPTGVRITAIAPHLDKEALAIDLTADAQTHEQGLELLKRLQQSAAFRDVMPLGENTSNGVNEFHYTMRYDPSAPAEEARPALAAPGDDSGDAGSTADSAGEEDTQ